MVNVDYKLNKLIYRYRMMGFDKPIFENNSYFKCRTMIVLGPCGQWKMIKGNSDYSCIVGALKWAKANWRYIQKEREKLIREYPKPRYTGMKLIFSGNYGNKH